MGVRFCSFHHPRAERSSHQMWSQAGNSMNVLVMGMLELHSLWSWRRTPIPKLLACIHSARLVQWTKQLALFGGAKCSLSEQEKPEESEAVCKIRKLKSNSMCSSASAAVIPPLPKKRFVGKQEDPDPASLSFALRREIMQKGRRDFQAIGDCGASSGKNKVHAPTKRLRESGA